MTPSQTRETVITQVVQNPKVEAVDLTDDLDTIPETQAVEYDPWATLQVTTPTTTPLQIPVRTSTTSVGTSPSSTPLALSPLSTQSLAAQQIHPRASNGAPSRISGVGMPSPMVRLPNGGPAMGAGAIPLLNGEALKNVQPWDLAAHSSMPPH